MGGDEVWSKMQFQWLDTFDGNGIEEIEREWRGNTPYMLS
jgi:hypothetical protein